VQVSEATLHALLATRPPRPAVDALLAGERLAAIEDARDAACCGTCAPGSRTCRAALRRHGFGSFSRARSSAAPCRLELAGAGVSAHAIDELLREVFDLADALARRSE